MLIGLDATAARAAWGPLPRGMLLVTELGEGPAGAAAICEVAGVQGQLGQGFSPGYGYAAPIAVWLDRLHPWGIAIASVLPGNPMVGNDRLQATMNLTPAGPYLLQGLILAGPGSGQRTCPAPAQGSDIQTVIDERFDLRPSHEGFIVRPMSEPKDLPTLTREELLALVVELQRQVAELRTSHEALRAELDQLTRGGKRQAAPCSRGTRVTDPTPPGRTPGSGTCHDRGAPPPETVTEPPVEVLVTLAGCPTCGGPLAEERVDFVYTTELPARPRPQVTPYRVWVCRCTGCGHQVRGQPPDLASDPYGATAHRLGPRVRAAAHAVHDGVGVPVRQVPAVLQVLTGVQVTQGALTQDALRQAQATVGTVDAPWRAVVPGAPVVHTDDTGWRVGGEAASLMAFETDTATVYQMRSRHRHEAVQEVIPADDEGVMVTDRGRRDDARAFDHVAQQKCLSHILRSLRDVVEAKRGRARDVGARLKGLWQDALALWQAHRDGDARQCKAEALHAELTYHLRTRRPQDPDHQRRLNALGWHHDRGNLVRFLADPWIEPTNHRAERALRPAVIARNVSQGAKSGRGADAFAAFTSVIRTLMNAGAGSVVDELSKLFRRPQPQHVPTSPSRLAANQ